MNIDILFRYLENISVSRLHKEFRENGKFRPILKFEKNQTLEIWIYNI